MTLIPKVPQDIEKKVLSRDDHTCQCCGFQAEKYQMIHNRKSQHKYDDPAELITVCNFCYQVLHMEVVGTMRSGVLVWLPEISQAELHNIMRAIYVARISQGPVADSARKALDILMDRRGEARNRLGTDKPEILAMVLQDYISPAAYKRRAAKLDGMRLLPLDRRIVKEGDMEFNQFPQILAYWRSKAGPFGGLLPRQWGSVYQRLGDEKEAS